MSNDNIRLAYVDTCGVHTMLMIHGFPLNNTMWIPQFDDLYDIARMVAPDLPGHGVSEPIDLNSYEMSLLADQCIDLLDGLDITDPVVVCGLSMGGYVAFELFRNYPERIKGLILAATRATADNEETKSKRNAAVSKLKKHGMEKVVDEMLPTLFSPTTLEANEELVDFVRDMMMGTNAEGAAAAVRGMQNRTDSSFLLDKIEVPTLILHGEDDQIVSQPEAEMMQRHIPGANMYIVPDAGHLVTMEQPDIVNSLIADYLVDL